MTHFCIILEAEILIEKVKMRGTVTEIYYRKKNLFSIKMLW